MRTSVRGNRKRRSHEEGSILVDAVVTMLILCSLGLAVLGLLVSSFQRLSSYDAEVFRCLDQLASPVVVKP